MTTTNTFPKWNAPNAFGHQLRIDVVAKHGEEGAKAIFKAHPKGFLGYLQDQWRTLSDDRKAHFTAIAKNVREGRVNTDGVAIAPPASVPGVPTGTVAIKTKAPNAWTLFQQSYATYCRQKNITFPTAEGVGRSTAASAMYNSMNDEVFAKFLLDFPPSAKPKAGKKATATAPAIAPAPLV